MENIRSRLTGRSSLAHAHLMGQPPPPSQRQHTWSSSRNTPPGTPLSPGPLLVIASPDEKVDSHSLQHAARAKRCVDEGVAAGSVAAAWACAISAVPTLVICRTVPWAKVNLNYTAQALIISAASIATYFIVTEQTILKCTKETSRAALEEKRAGTD